VIRRIANSTGKAPLLLLVGRGSGLLLSVWFSFIFLLLILAFLCKGLNRMTLFLTVPVRLFQMSALTDGAGVGEEEDPGW
jgi:hypothetical protein